ncbi:MAG: hypothetical protein HGA44_21065, partial [Cellulomonadaceae bacterium]|nr:hypothetical protein [Cellulomonadaceae bacterium]
MSDQQQVPAGFTPPHQAGQAHNSLTVVLPPVAPVMPGEPVALAPVPDGHASWRADPQPVARQ